MRVRIVNFTVISVFLILILGLLNFEVIKGEKFKNLSDKNCIRLLPQIGARGKILDRQGEVIVDNQLTYDLMIFSSEAKQINETLRKLSGILGTSFEDLKEAFKKGAAVPSIAITLVKNIDLKTVIAIEELKADLSGVIVQPHPVRHYRYARLASHVLGYLNEIDRWRLTKLADYGYKTKDIVGFGGVEEKYDYYLRQEQGGLSVEVDHQGRLVRVLGFQPPRDGKDIQLTLDLEIQKIVEDNLGEQKGSVMMMNPHTGEIIALASNPNFNPSLFVKRSGSAIRNLFSNTDAPLINRAISGVYPPGSVFKVIVATAALETGKINSSTTFFCTGSTQVGREDFSCWQTHGQQNLISAIAHSCNVFFYKTGLLLGAQILHDYALKFGLSRPTGIDLPVETSGFVPSILWRKISKMKKWFDGDTANFAIGQGELLVTPLQLARMMAVFANRGFLVRPYITKAIGGEDISLYQRKVVPLLMQQSTMENIRKGLRNVVAELDGTASNLAGLSISVAGKTGTAQVARAQPHGWFVGFFPFKNPKFVLCVFLENSGAGFHASSLAKKIIAAMIQEGII